MNRSSDTHSTGLDALDSILGGLQPGDNVVWKVDDIDHYRRFVEPLADVARNTQRRLVYLRFAQYPPLVPGDIGAEIHTLEPEEGFEEFISRIHQVIETYGATAYFVFDSLSDLALENFSDSMVSNFFQLTCPFVLAKGAIAYFAMQRSLHTSATAGAIADTTQILIDVYPHKDMLYIHPQKTSDRFTPTLYMLHRLDGHELIPITDSATVAEVLTSASSTGLETANYQMGVWNRLFLLAEDLLEQSKRGVCSHEHLDEVFNRLLRMVITQDERMLSLAQRYLTLEDIVRVRQRMIGTGFIGGKTVGMLLAHAILRRSDPRWDNLLETPDSFYIGTDVFYSFLVSNGCWWIRKRLQDPESCLLGTEQVIDCIENGTFPNSILRRFEAMLDYYGQSSIIARSSSLMEDGFGNTFAGRYESVFCANQGSREERMRDFLAAVRRIYASSVCEKALHYRSERGLLDQDEQMALLVQRVSGVRCGFRFYPHLAGVGYSLNPYVWSKAIDPKAGTLRLVFGLGTRAVNRSEDDYTRIVALNAPQLRPETEPREIRRYSQRKADVLNLQDNRLTSEFITEMIQECPDLPSELFLTLDEEFHNLSRDKETQRLHSTALTFERAFQTPILADLQTILKTLEDAYRHPVDIEFTVNYLTDRNYKIGLWQCRPFQIHGLGPSVTLPENPAREDVALQCSGAVIGPSRTLRIDAVVYVASSVYGRLTQSECYSIARIIGQVTRHAELKNRTILLIGPGRWGTTTPSLGVPVSFAEISQVSVLCEVEAMREDLIPDVSLGTHFFTSLVEKDILYLAVFPNREENFVNEEWMDSHTNELARLVPNAEKFASCIRVVRDDRLFLYADTLEQKAVGFVKE